MTTKQITPAARKAARIRSRERLTRRRSRSSRYSRRELSAALLEMLGEPVRVTFTARPRWMSGYEALVLLLRTRAAEGDVTAGETLADLLQRVGLAERLDPVVGEGDAPATSPEKQLDAAFAERMRQQALHSDESAAGAATSR